MWSSGFWVRGFGFRRCRISRKGVRGCSEQDSGSKIWDGTRSILGVLADESSCSSSVLRALPGKIAG